MAKSGKCLKWISTSSTITKTKCQRFHNIVFRRRYVMLCRNLTKNPQHSTNSRGIVSRYTAIWIKIFANIQNQQYVDVWVVSVHLSISWNMNVHCVQEQEEKKKTIKFLMDLFVWKASAKVSTRMLPVKGFSTFSRYTFGARFTLISSHIAINKMRLAHTQDGGR